MALKHKAQMRREMKVIVSSLDRRWLKAASSELCQHLTDLIDTEIGSRIRHILAWTTFFPGEADLSPFISDQLERRLVYLPRVSPDGSMTFLSIDRDWLTSVESGAFGIPEPISSSAEHYDPSTAGETVVVVPGLAFDAQGNRLGRGKGAYDTFFARPNMYQAVKVGVCWSLQLVPSVPSESHDAQMDFICHERGYIRVEDEGDVERGS